ncbi:MAG: TPM domain-containing protein [Bacillota bacterium]
MIEKYVRKKSVYLAVITVAFLLYSIQCFAAIPPKPTTSIYCQDLAGVLDAKLVGQINKISTDLNSKSGAQLVVLTVDSLDGVPLDEYSLQVLRDWGIGDKSKNNGVLILIAVKDKKSRIEVGYGLEGALPDGKTGRIQDDYMLPNFKKGNYSEGTWQGYQAVAVAIAKEYQIDIGQGRDPPASKQADSGQQLPTWMVVLIAIGVVVLLIIDWVFFGGTFTWLIIALIFRRGGGGGGGSGGDSFGGGSGGGGGSSRSW